ncbi:MAG: hypothetical protein ABW360_04445 [Phenylobacterium sp.]
MTGFSASDAALAGFQVIREKWRLVAGWALFNLLALVAAVVVTFLLIGIGVAFAGSRDQAGSIGGVIGAVVLGLGAFLIEVMIVSALFRAVLREEPPGFLHLRLGFDEGRVAVVWLGMLAGSVVIVILGALAAAAATRAAGGWAGVAVVLIAAVLLVWLALRLALAAPVAIAEHRIGFFRSWRLTRGRTLPLLGMSALAACLVIMVAVAAWLLLVLLIGLVAGFEGIGLLSLSDADAYAQRPALYLSQLGAQFLFTPVLWVLSQAPLVAAYRAFTAED